MLLTDVIILLSMSIDLTLRGKTNDVTEGLPLLLTSNDFIRLELKLSFIHV